MSPLVLILILILLFGGGGGYYAYGPMAESGTGESSSSFFSCWRSLGACSAGAAPRIVRKVDPFELTRARRLPPFRITFARAGTPHTPGHPLFAPSAGDDYGGYRTPNLSRGSDLRERFFLSSAELVELAMCPRGRRRAARLAWPRASRLPRP